MCGEHGLIGEVERCSRGSSPHVRGAPARSGERCRRRGIIPACAGSTRQSERAGLRGGDHPRMCGEHETHGFRRVAPTGSSPHVRGAQAFEFGLRVLDGIIPACAGSTRLSAVYPTMRWDHPRMCGEHFQPWPNTTPYLGSSPHVRGAHFENSIIPRKRKDNWLFFIQFRFENFLAFRYLLALLHPFLGVPTKDPSFASLGRLINCNPSQSTGDQSAPYTLKAICCSFLAE